MSCNENLKYIDFLKKNIDKLNIGMLSSINKNALSVIIEYNYDEIKKHFYSGYGKELIEWIYNPNNMHRWSTLCWNLDEII